MNLIVRRVFAASEGCTKWQEIKHFSECGDIYHFDIGESVWGEPYSATNYLCKVTP